MRKSELVVMAIACSLASPSLLAQTGLRVYPGGHGSGYASGNDGGAASLPSPRLADVRMIDPYALAGAAGDGARIGGYVPTAPGAGFAVGSFNLYDGQASGMSFDLTPAGRAEAAPGPAGQEYAPGNYSIQGDLYRTYGRFAAFGSLGWKKLTSATGLNLGDPHFGSVGGLYRFSADTTGGLSYDRGQNVFYSRNYGGGLTAFMTHKLGQGLKLQGYVLKGLAEGSPNWGAGALFSVGF